MGVVPFLFGTSGRFHVTIFLTKVIGMKPVSLVRTGPNIS